MAEVSVTIRTTKPDEAAKLAQLLNEFFGNSTTTTIIKEDVKVNIPEQQPATAVVKDVAAPSTNGTQLDAGILRAKVAKKLEDKELNDRIPDVRGQITAKIKELKATSVTTLKPEHFEEFDQFLDTIK